MARRRAGESAGSRRGPRNYHELGKMGGEARKRQLMGGGRRGEE